MATEADISDLISPMKIELEDKEHSSGNSKIPSEEFTGVEEKVESGYTQPTLEARENMQVEKGTRPADVHVVNEGIVKAMEGENLQSPSVADEELDQLNFTEKLSGEQKGEKIEMETDENVIVASNLDQNANSVTEPKATLSEEDSPQVNFNGGDESQNKSSESLLTENERIHKVEKTEISKQESDHVKKDIVEDNLKNKSEARKHEEVDNIMTEERDLKETPEHEESSESSLHNNQSATENVEMPSIKTSKGIETTPLSEMPNQIPAKETGTIIFDDVKELATPEEKSFQEFEEPNISNKGERIDEDVNNELIDISKYSNSEGMKNYTQENETVAKIGEVKELEESSLQKAQENKIGNDTEMSEDVPSFESQTPREEICEKKMEDSQANETSTKIGIKEELEEPSPKRAEENKIGNDTEKSEDVSSFVSQAPTEELYEEMEDTQEDKKLIKIRKEEELEEPSLHKSEEDKIGNYIEKSEDVSSFISQAPTEEIHEEKMEDTKKCAEKFDMVPRVTEATSSTEIKLIDKPLEEDPTMESQLLLEHEIEKKDLEKAKKLDAESGFDVENVHDIFETTTSPAVEKSGATEIEKIIKEVPNELVEPLDQGAETDYNAETAPYQTIQAEETKEQLPVSSFVLLSGKENGQKESKAAIEDKTGLEGSDIVDKSNDHKFNETHKTSTSAKSEENEEVSDNNGAGTLKPVTEPNYHCAGDGITDKTETKFIEQDADGVTEENFSELTHETKVQREEENDFTKPQLPQVEIQAGEEDEERKDVPKTVSEPQYQGAESIIEGKTSPDDAEIGKTRNQVQNGDVITETSIDVGSSEADQSEVLSREDPEAIPELTDQVVESVRNNDIVAPTEATEEKSLNEIQLNDEPINITSSSSTAESIETTKNADMSRQDEGIEKIILDDATIDVSGRMHDDEQQDSGRDKVDNEVEEAITPEHNDQVVEDTPINEEKEITEAVPASVSEINCQGDGAIIEEDISLETCSILINDQPRETTTDVDMVNAESIKKNDSLLKEDTTDSFKTGTTGNIASRELDTQIRAIEEGTDNSVNTGTEVTLVGESKLMDPMNSIGTNSETISPETTGTVDTSKQDPEVDDITLEETLAVESQLLKKENETEAHESITEEKTDAESESLVHNVEKIIETDSSPAMRDTQTSGTENVSREVPEVIHQASEDGGNNKSAPGYSIEAESKQEQVHLSSFAFLPSEESHESEPIENKEDVHGKKDDAEENNLKLQEDSDVVSRHQNIETVEKPDVDVVKAEEATWFDAESRDIVEELYEAEAIPNTEISIPDGRKEESESLAERMSAIDDEIDERPLATGESEEYLESSSALLSVLKYGAEESKVSEIEKDSDVLSFEKSHETEATAAAEKTQASKVEQETEESLETITEPKCHDIGAIIDQEILSNQIFPLENVEDPKNGVEETDIASTSASEVTNLGKVNPSYKAIGDFDIKSDSKTSETTETVDTYQQDPELESIKPEEASLMEPKLEEYDSKIEAQESLTEEKTEAGDVEVETTKVLGVESESSSIEEIHEANVSPAAGNTETNGSDSIDGIATTRMNQAENFEGGVLNPSSGFLSSEKRHEYETSSAKITESDSLELHETSALLSQLQNTETREPSDADEVKEEVKGFVGVCESKNGGEEIGTGTGETAEVPREVKMEEETNRQDDKISDTEGVHEDVPAAESIGVSKCPTENPDMGADNKHPADDEPGVAMVSEPLPKSRVLGVQNIEDTETSPSVGENHTDREEDETKKVLGTTLKPALEDVPKIITQGIISNQSFPHENMADTEHGVEETGIAATGVTKEGSMGEINLIDELMKASDTSSDTKTIETIPTACTTIPDTEIDKSQLPEHEKKISHANIVQNAQDIDKTSTSTTLGESDANGNVNVCDVKETKSYSSMVEPKDQAVEGVHETTIPAAREDDINGTYQETREAPETVTKEINQDAGEVSTKEISLTQPIDKGETKKQEEESFDPMPESKYQNFEEDYDTKRIPAAEIDESDNTNEAGTEVFEKMSGGTYTGFEAIVDGQTQATKRDTETAFESINQGIGDFTENEINMQPKEPLSDLLEDRDQEAIIKDGIIKAEGTDKNNNLLNENAVDSLEARRKDEEGSAIPVDEKCTEDFHLEDDKIGKALQPESEIHESQLEHIPKVTAIIDEQLEEAVVNLGEGGSETRDDYTTEAAQAHEISSGKTLIEDHEKAEAKPHKEAIISDNYSLETPEQVLIEMGTANVNAAEEETSLDYVEKEPITENAGKECDSLVTEATGSIKEVKIPEVTLGNQENKLGHCNDEDDIARAKISNIENQVEREKREDEFPKPACEEKGTEGSVGIEEQEQETITNATDISSSKNTSGEELADKGEIKVEEKPLDFILDPVSITPSVEEKVKKLEEIPEANNQKATGDVTETKELVKEPQEQEKISPSLSDAQIARNKDLNEEKESKLAIANSDFQATSEDSIVAKQVDAKEGKVGAESPETTNKLTPNNPAEVLSSEILEKPRDQINQVAEEPKTEAEERTPVEEEKTDEEEDDETKKADSGSDAPVMVEASKDIDVKSPHKKSHNIFSGVGSKMKNSIAKVKKAVTGKSSHQKSSSPKEDKKKEALL